MHSLYQIRGIIRTTTSAAWRLFHFLPSWRIMLLRTDFGVVGVNGHLTATGLGSWPPNVVSDVVSPGCDPVRVLLGKQHRARSRAGLLDQITQCRGAQEVVSESGVEGFKQNDCHPPISRHNHKLSNTFTPSQTLSSIYIDLAPCHTQRYPSPPTCSLSQATQ
jgi:hypothetical protein